MKYLVIGEPCVDLIHKANGEVIHSYGGILYSTIALAVLSAKTDEIYPVMNLGEDEYGGIVEELKKHPNIRIEGINKINYPTRKVNLYYNNYNSGKSARIEHSTAPTYTIAFDWIEKFIPGTDAILVNMISGVDITLETLQKIRANFGGFMHIDIHNIVMKTNEDGSRVHTNIEDWIQWCINTDTIQMNEFEIASLSKVKKNEYEIVEEILSNPASHTKYVIVTRGVNGVTGFTRKEKSFGNEKFFDLDKINIASAENPNFLDSTGCGDVFAASFTREFSVNKDFKKGIHFANRVASYNTSLEGIENLYKLK